MSMTGFSGSWDLVSYSYVKDQQALPDDDSSEARLAWLIGVTDVSTEMREANGLRIAIQQETFEETSAAFSELMFDVEGVQVNDYQPLHGSVRVIDGVGFLLPEGVPDYASLPVKDGIASRYSDGDTVVCDTLRIVNGNMLRQVSVVTDEFYLDRVLLLYKLLPTNLAC